MPNYFAPGFRVQINGTRLNADVSRNIQQISITTKPDSLDDFTLTVANAYPQMRWTHTPDAELFREGSSVNIEMGYLDDLEACFNGASTKISPTFPESGMPTVSIDGHTRLHWLQADKKTRTFQKMTDKQIAEKIA